MIASVDLNRVKTIVNHLTNSWVAVLRQRQYIQTISDSPALIAALDHTYAVHVHNTLGAALVMDLIRSAGALILDRSKGVASLARAVHLLSHDTTLRALTAEVADVKPNRFVDAMTAAALRKPMSEHAKSYYRDAPADLKRIECDVLNSQAAGTIQTVRHMAVAHNALVFKGGNWKLWRIEEAGLTYGELDAFIDGCNQAIGRVDQLALRERCDFTQAPQQAQRCAEEYVQALVRGLETSP